LVYGCRKALTCKDGSFRFEGVVPGKYRIELLMDDKLPY